MIPRPFLPVIALAVCLSGCRVATASLTPPYNDGIVHRQTYQFSQEQRDEPNADSDRIAIGGISYGGMMTYLALARTDEVKNAFAVGAPTTACDWTRWVPRSWSTMDWRLHELGFPSSPIHFAHLINTPILIQHGTADPHVSSKNAQLMAAALDYYGKPRKLSIYEGGNHNLTTHWPEAFEERLDWLASHL